MRQFRVAWQDWKAFAGLLVGGWSIVGSEYRRIAPLKFPGLDDIVVDNVSIEPFDDFAPSGADVSTIERGTNSYPSGVARITAGYRSIFDYRRALCSKGIYSLIVGSRSTIFQIIFLGPLISLIGNKKMGLVAWKPNKKEDLDYIVQLVESGKVKHVIDRCYPLDEIDDAFRYFEEGNPRGKVVITMESNNKK